MFKAINFRLSLVVASLAALLFCIPAFFFTQSADYKSYWLFYLGSFVFMEVIWKHITIDSRQRDNNAAAGTLIFVSEVTTVMVIFLTIALCRLMMLLFVPGYFKGNISQVILREPASNTIHDKTERLSFELFTAATLINFFVGSFAAVILPFYLKRNQKSNTKRADSNPWHLTQIKFV